MPLLLLVFTIAQQAMITPPKRSPLAAALTVGEYFGEEYVQSIVEERKLFVFFVGEPIKIRVTIGNRGPAEHEFRLGESDSPFAVNALRDGQRIDIDVSFDTGVWRGVEGGSAPFDRAVATHLKAREGVHWTGTVDTPLPPGRYRLSIAPNGSQDGNGLPILTDVSTHVFEVQPRSAEVEPEIARREVLRYLLGNDADKLARAEGAVERLLKLHPTSYAAFYMRGQIAEARGDKRLAAASFDRAAEILRTDQDTVLVKVKPRHEREKLLAHVDALRNRK